MAAHGGERILVGRFGAPHGLKGDLRLQSFTDVPNAIASYEPLTDASGVRRFSIKTLRHVKDNVFVARIVGIEDRTAAESLTNLQLFLPRDCLPKTDEDEFYLADLIGLAAVRKSGESIGRVTNVLNFGAGDILEIAPEGGGEALLLPFAKAVVPEIDIKGGRLIVAPPVEIEAELFSEKADESQHRPEQTKPSPDEI
ncbi:MAG: ribosome maturation factor RimM [Methylocella sp.]